MIGSTSRRHEDRPTDENWQAFIRGLGDAVYYNPKFAEQMFTDPNWSRLAFRALNAHPRIEVQMLMPKGQPPMVIKPYGSTVYPDWHKRCTETRHDCATPEEVQSACAVEKAA